MTDDTETTQPAIVIRDPFQVPITFVSEVCGSGFLNGVVNLTLDAFNFTPVGNEVEPDRVIVSRLRFDLFCAQQIHAQLGKIIDEQTKGPAQPAAKTH